MDYFKEDLKKKRSQKIVACLVAPARNSVVCFSLSQYSHILNHDILTFRKCPKKKQTRYLNVSSEMQSCWSLKHVGNPILSELWIWGKKKSQTGNRDETFLDLNGLVFCVFSILFLVISQIWMCFFPWFFSDVPPCFRGKKALKRYCQKRDSRSPLSQAPRPSNESEPRSNSGCVCFCWD